MEITYCTAASEFNTIIIIAEYPEMMHGVHSLRSGGATAYASMAGGSEMIATSMGAGGASRNATTYRAARNIKTMPVYSAR